MLISPAAMQSNWVRREVELAMAASHLKGRVVPILIEEAEDWTLIHEHIGRLQSLRLYNDREESLTRVIEGIYKRPRHLHPPYRVGDAMIQVLIPAGGNGRTRYRCGDIVCDGPSADTSQRKYHLPPDIAIDAESRLEAIKSSLKNKMFVNNPQARLCDFLSGGANGSGGLTDLPLRLELGWTEYFHTRLTNQERGYRLPDGQSSELKYGRELDDLGDSQLSNPIATNMSVVTSDRKIFLSTRGMKVA